ncbi:hypothetical protein LEMLEM_LOCUS2271, partial [Lemmus lemmus]
MWTIQCGLSTHVDDTCGLSTHVDNTVWTQHTCGQYSVDSAHMWTIQCG